MRLFGSQDPSRFGFTAIQVSKRDYVAWIAFNRPQVLNAINLTVLQELQIAFKDALWDDAIAVVVLTGVGERAFCTGADLQEQKQFRERPRDYYKWIREFIATHELMRNLGKPIVARLNGIVVGGGNEFNLSCDLAIAADDIYLRQVGSSRGSVALAGATQFLPLMVGERRAREILLLNEEIPAAKALQWGLVNEVAPRAELDAAVERLCQKLVNKFPEKTRYTKQQLNFWRDLSWHLTIGHGADWLAIHNTSPETMEGISAFDERRQPDYEQMRAAWANDEAPEFFWGPPLRTCQACGADHIPSQFTFCGACGAALNPTP